MRAIAALPALLLVPALPLLLLLLALPAVTPLASPDVSQLYQDAVASHLRDMATETTAGQPVPSLDWREVLVVDAVRREQRLHDVTSADAKTAAARFTKRHRREELRCPPTDAQPADPPSTPDSDDDPSPECETVVIVWYEAVPFDEVLFQLRFSPDQVQWAHDMLRTLADVSP